MYRKIKLFCRFNTGIFLEKEHLMNYFKVVLLLIIVTFSFGQLDYSLEDINSSSIYFGQNVGTSTFENHVTIHYFGHYN